MQRGKAFLGGWVWEEKHTLKKGGEQDNQKREKGR